MERAFAAVGPKITYLVAFLLASAAVDARAFDEPPSLSSAAIRLRGRIDKVFAKDAIKLKGEEDYDRGYRFTIFDEANGFARVRGPFEGYDDFFLLRGPAADYMVYVEYSCGSACSQRVTAHRLNSVGPPTLIPLTDMLDLSQFLPVRRRLLNTCFDAVGSYNTERRARDAGHRNLQACPYVFSFPKAGSGATLFRVLNEDGSDLLLSVGKSAVSPEVLLHWNGAKLVGGESEAAEPIQLDSRAMKLLF